MATNILSLQPPVPSTPFTAKGSFTVCLAGVKLHGSKEPLTGTVSHTLPQVGPNENQDVLFEIQTFSFGRSRVG